MHQQRPHNTRGESDILLVIIATLSVGLVMALYYGLFVFFQQFTSPEVSAFIATGVLVTILGISIQRKFKYGRVIPDKYFPEDAVEEDTLPEETQRLIEETRKLDQVSDEDDSPSSSTILSGSNDEDTTGSSTEEAGADEVDIDPSTLPRDLYMQVLKKDDYSLADAKADADARTE